jgi:hypothetical protein
MKRLLLLMLLATSLDGVAQYRLNISKHDLKKEFHDLELIQHNHDTLIYARTADIGILLYYIKDDLCFTTALFPADNITLKQLIKDYDLKYIRATPNTWEQYLPEGVVECSLHQGSDHKWFFLFQTK